MFLNFFYSILYYLVHIFYSLVTLFYKWKEKNLRKIYFKSFNLNQIKINKIPNHIVFVIHWKENFLNLDEIALLLKWSIDLQIANISIYDYQGDLINQKDAFQKSINKLINNFQFKINQNNGFTDINYILEEDYLSSKIKIISNINAKQFLVSVSKEIIRKIEKLGLKPYNSIEPQLISKLLYSKLHLPDPELIILCSPTPCLLNFLPWHIRLSEIVNLQFWRHLEYQDFIYVISKYSKSEQHFGK